MPPALSSATAAPADVTLSMKTAGTPMPVPAGRRNDDTVDLMRAEADQGLALAPGVALGVDHQHVVALPLDNVLHALQRRRVERRRDVGNDQPDRHRRAAAQRAREPVGLEAQALGDLPDARPRLLVHERTVR